MSLLYQPSRHSLAQACRFSRDPMTSEQKGSFWVAFASGIALGGAAAIAAVHAGYVYSQRQSQQAKQANRYPYL